MTMGKKNLDFDPDQLALVIDGHPSPTLVIENDTGEVLYLNDEARRYFGIEANDTTTYHGRDFVADLERFKEFLAILTEEGEVHGFELPAKKTNGHRCNALASARVIIYGGRTATMTNVVDITVQKIVESELARKGKLLEQAQDMAAVAAWEWFFDTETRTGEFQISEKTARVFGWQPVARSIDSNEFLKFVHPDDRTSLTSSLADLKTQGSRFALEFRIGPEEVNADGPYRWVKALGDPFFSKDGLVEAIAGSIQDITEQKNFDQQLEETSHKLAASEARFRDYAEVSADWLWETGSGNRITRIAQSFCDILGKSQSDLIGRRYRELSPADVRDYPEKWQDILERTEARRIFRDFQFAMKKWDGHPVHVSISGKPVYDHEGNFVGYRGTGANITQLHEATVKMEKARRDADSANAAKSEFLSNMSHELRTPLNSILGFSQLLMGADNLTSKQMKQASFIKDGGEHLLRLINDILDLAKIEAGKLEVMSVPVQLSELLANCVDFTATLAKEANVAVTNEVIGSADHTVLADELRIRQVMLNLLSNAIKYNVSGGTVRLHASEVTANLLRISVTDTGLGIAAEKQQELFQPFSRLGAEATEIEGAGIGLALTQQLIGTMGGEIGVESAAGEGSTFWVDLPMAKTSKPKIQHTRHKITGGGTLETAVGTVLYVEDNEPNRCLMEILLSSAPNIKLICTPNAEEGLATLDREDVSLVISDINLPGMSGIDLARSLRSDPKLETLPLVALSADARTQTRDEALEAGFDDYLSKPFNLKVMAANIAAILGSGDQPG